MFLQWPRMKCLMLFGRETYVKTRSLTLHTVVESVNFIILEYIHRGKTCAPKRDFLCFPFGCLSMEVFVCVVL